MKTKPAESKLPTLAGLVAAGIVAVPTVLLLGPGLLGIAIAAPAAAAAIAAGYRLTDNRVRAKEAPRLASSGPQRTVVVVAPDADMLQDIQRMIDQFDRVQSQVPSSEGKALIWQAIEASQLVVERLRQETTPASQARRVHHKLKSYALILSHYEALINRKLLTPDEDYRQALIAQIETDALPRIARQLESFARSMDEDEIMELEVELQLLRQLS